jgi:hypothetical protein
MLASAEEMVPVGIPENRPCQEDTSEEEEATEVASSEDVAEILLLTVEILEGDSLVVRVPSAGVVTAEGV